MGEDRPDSAGEPRPDTVRQVAATLAARYVPITQWLPAYPRDWLRRDLTAALTSWGVMVPVALAYAGLAGVPPELGLVTAFAALAAYAVFGTSRHLKVTTSSTMAIMSASVVAGFAGGDPSAYLALRGPRPDGRRHPRRGRHREARVHLRLPRQVRGHRASSSGSRSRSSSGSCPSSSGLPSLSGSLPEQVVQLVGELPETNPTPWPSGLRPWLLILVLRAGRAAGPRPAHRARAGDPRGARLRPHGARRQRGGRGRDGRAAAVDPAGSAHATFPTSPSGRPGSSSSRSANRSGAGRAYAVRHGYEIDADQEMLALGAANLCHPACSAGSRPTPACPRRPPPRAAGAGRSSPRW